MAGQHGGSGLDHQTNLEQILEANLDRFQLGQANILTDGGPWCYKGAQPPPYLHIALSGQETHRLPDSGAADPEQGAQLRFVGELGSRAQLRVGNNHLEQTVSGLVGQFF